MGGRRCRRRATKTVLRLPRPSGVQIRGQVKGTASHEVGAATRPMRADKRAAAITCSSSDIIKSRPASPSGSLVLQGNQRKVAPHRLMPIMLRKQIGLLTFPSHTMTTFFVSLMFNRTMLGWNSRKPTQGMLLYCSVSTLTPCRVSDRRFNA